METQSLDIKSILYELDAWKRGERGSKLTWGFLENFSGYSRQSLWNQYRQTLEKRVKSLEAEIDNLKTQQNNWLELWARYEYNAKNLGINTKVLAKPLPEIYR